MKIAIPTMDGLSISQHFGKCKAFLVFDIEGGSITSNELRENTHGCGGHGQDHHHETGDHHGGFVRLLGDCQAVIALGIGGGAMQALRAAGISVCTMPEPCSPEEAITRFASGLLTENAGSSCACHDHH